MTTGVGLVGSVRVDASICNGAGAMAHDCYLETGGPSIPGTFLPKSDKLSSVCCWETPSVTGTYPESNREAGKDALPDLSPE